MGTNRIKELWGSCKPVLTGWCSTPDPYTTEVMVRSGFDALILDMQHGMGIGPERAATWLQIVGQSDATPLVRVPWNEPTPIQYVLDAGAMGVIVPMVNNVADTEKAIASCRYPPDGYRSVGPNRADLIGGMDYIMSANREIICLVMIESVQGLESIEEIARLHGLDGFFIGPVDLACSMGFTPDINCREPAHEEAIQRIIDTAKKNNQNAGIFTSNAAEAVRRFKQGFNLNPAVADIRLFAGAVKGSISKYRAALKNI